MKVSLCMIVKDEIDHLEKCLDSVEHLVDEIVIVDTGSTDGTWELVQTRANNYKQIKWKGFAHARNEAQALATHDAIFILDADEWVSNDGGWPQAIKALDEGYDGVAIMLHNELPDNQILQGDEVWQIRFYIRREGIEWEGSVHNQIATALVANPLDGKDAKFFQAPIRIEHIGYALPPEKLKSKYKARLDDLLHEIMKAELAEDKRAEAYYHYQTANAYFMLRDYEKSLRYCLSADLEHMTDENAYSTCLMACHTSHTMELKDEARKWAMKMFEIWPREAMSFFMRGLAHLADDESLEAYNFLGAALAMSQIPNMPYKYKLDSHYVAAAAGEAALSMKPPRLQDAKELFKMHLQKYQTPRVAELEAAIMTEDEARERGLISPDMPGLPSPTQVEKSGVVPDSRLTGSQSLSEESLEEIPMPK